MGEESTSWRGSMGRMSLVAKLDECTEASSPDRLVVRGLENDLDKARARIARLETVLEDCRRSLYEWNTREQLLRLERAIVRVLEA